MAFYLPILKGPYGNNSPGDWTPEAELYTREALVEDIRSGQIDPAPIKVLEIDAEAGTAKDVTSEIAIDVGDATFGQQIVPFDDLVRWLDKHGAGYFEGPAPWLDQQREWGTLSRRQQL